MVGRAKEGELSMKENPPKLHLGIRMLLGLAAGSLFALSFPPYNLPILLPIAVASLLWLLNNATVREAFYIGLFCGISYFGGTLYWLGNIFYQATIPLCVIVALFPALFSALYVWLNRRLPLLPLWVVAAITWTAIEVYRSELFVLNFGWMGLGYGVARFPALASGAAWFGSYGLTFGIVALGAFMIKPASNKKRFYMRSIGLLLFWLALFILPHIEPVIKSHLNVRLVQAMVDERAFFQLSRSPSVIKPDIIVWTEYALKEDPELNPKLWQELQQLARESKSCLIFGGEHTLNEKFYTYENSAYVLDPNGELIGRHVKNHTVHLFKDGKPGTQARAFNTPFGKIGIGICFDMDYPDVARKLVQDGAEVLLIPNMDPDEWGSAQHEQHRLIFQMRAIECGRWLARADVAGGTSVVSPSGKEVARVHTNQETFLDASVGREKYLTPYVQGGWRFSQACLLAFGILFLWSLMPTRLRPVPKESAVTVEAVKGSKPSEANG
jgi:apolipoprotein N-acyltransferase